MYLFYARGPGEARKSHRRASAAVRDSRRGSVGHRRGDRLRGDRVPTPAPIRATVTRRILITCPQMQQLRTDYIARLAAAQGLEADVPPVVQQLRERELLEIIDRYEGVIAGDDEFTERVFDRATPAGDLQVGRGHRQHRPGGRAGARDPGHEHARRVCGRGGGRRRRLSRPAGAAAPSHRRRRSGRRVAEDRGDVAGREDGWRSSASGRSGPPSRVRASAMGMEVTGFETRPRIGARPSSRSESNWGTWTPSSAQPTSCRSTAR